MLSRLGKRGRKFLLYGVTLLLGGYLLCYLVVYWFLVSGRGQSWIEQTLSSRLGISARWQEAGLSAFLQPSLHDVMVEFASTQGRPYEFHARNMLLRWSISGNWGVHLYEIDSISGLPEGVNIGVRSADVAWERWEGTRRLSLVVDGSQIAVVVGGGELELIDVEVLRGAIPALYDVAESTLGKLVLSACRVSITRHDRVLEKLNVSLARERGVHPLRVWGRAFTQGGSELYIEGVLSGRSPSDATAEILVTSSDLRWLAKATARSWIPEEVLGPAAVLASISTTGPLQVFAHLGEPKVHGTYDAHLLLRGKTPEGVPRSTGTFASEISSVSPTTATFAANLEGIPLLQTVPGLSAGAVSASGTITFRESPTGRMDVAAAFEQLNYSTGDLRVSMPTGRIKVRADVSPKSGLQRGFFNLHAEPGHLALGSRQLDIPKLTLSVNGFETTTTGKVAFEQIQANLSGIGHVAGGVVGTLSPSLSLTGGVIGRELPLVRLWELGGQPETEWKPASGTADVTSRFQIDPHTKGLFAHAIVANPGISGTTAAAEQLEIEGKAVWSHDGSLTGSASLSGSNLSWRHLELPHASLSAQVSRATWEAPIQISDISASCHPVSAIGWIRLGLDGRQPRSLTYDTTVRIDDLSEGYAAIEETLKEVHLDGLDVGGQALVRLSGGLSRDGAWHASARARLNENHVLADTREIPAQWDNLHASLDLNARSQGRGVVETRAEGTLSDFVTLIGNYDVDAPGRSFRLAVTGVYDHSAGACSLESLVFQAPGRLLGQGHGVWSADGYSLAATLTAPDLTTSYESFLKDLLADCWTGAAALGIGGAAQLEVEVNKEPHCLRATGDLTLTDGSAQLGDQIGAAGISAALSGGLVSPVTGTPQIEPRRPMHLAAGLIQWGSNRVENIAVRPHIASGNILWEDTISVPLYGGSTRIGPVLITRLLSPDWRLGSSVRLRGLTTQPGPDTSEIVPTASELSADLSEIMMSQNVLAATGEMSLHIFDGLAKVSGIRVWQFFSSYPVWGGDLTFEHMDLGRVCAWLGLGRMEGRVSGSMRNLRLSIGEEIKPISFDLDVESDPGGGMVSREALRMIFDMSQQTAARIVLDRPQYAYGRLGLRAKLHKDRFFLWGKFKDGDMYYFVEPPNLISRLLRGKFHTVRIALNSPDRELSFDDVWTRVKAVTRPGLEQPQIEYSFFRRLNPLWVNPF